MSTSDVFSTAVKAMSTIVEVPLAGDIYALRAHSNGIDVLIDNDSQAAQALLAWLWWLSAAELSHWHGTNGTLYVEVQAVLAGARWRIWSWFTGEDAAALCEHAADNHEPISVHRLRKVQMRQTAAAVTR